MFGCCGGFVFGKYQGLVQSYWVVRNPAIPCLPDNELFSQRAHIYKYRTLNHQFKLWTVLTVVVNNTAQAVQLSQQQHCAWKDHPNEHGHKARFLEDYSVSECAVVQLACEGAKGVRVLKAAEPLPAIARMCWFLDYPDLAN